MFLHSVSQTIRRHNLLLRGQHILVGVSGGADSVALLAALRHLAPAWKLRLTVAHLNHGIRGAAARADADFVADLARRWKLQFVGGRINVPLNARQHGISLEMAGRSARYRFFAKAARAHHCDVVATAHTADDQAETVLLNLVRGAGAAGLAGIPYVGQHGAVKVVRPLRDVDRKSIERFLKSRHQAWREDATNANPVFLRNRVRHEVLPFLAARLNPGIRLALLRASAILAGENEWLDVLATEIFGQCRVPKAVQTLDAKKLAGFPVAARRRVLRCWLEACGLDAEPLGFDAIARLDNLLGDRRGGRAVTLPCGWIVRRDGDQLALSLDRQKALKAVGPHSLCGRKDGWTRRSSPTTRKSQLLWPPKSSTASVGLVVPGKTRLAGQGYRVIASIGPGIVKDRSRVVGAMPARASLSLRAWRKRRLLARAWKPGDRMRPLGLKGSKKLQDIFSDGKVPPGLRHRLPVIECQGEIVWIPGYRIAQGWAVHPNERKALQLGVEALT